MQERLTVSEATRLVKECLESSLGPLWVTGEISNFVAHSSGHFYFSLKDSGAQLRCVMFRGANRRLRFSPADGMLCAAFGRLGVYARGGQYQLICERMLPVGEGELQLAFEALKGRLADAGLFDPERKLVPPAYPRTIGVVTSPTGAAIRDIIKVLKRRWPPIRIVLRPALVQGPGAAADVAAGISELGRRADIDLMIVGRGGGSLEDLWAFNEEPVARAIAAARIPVISAVGHEIDHTIADMVADLRAPTPSAAAELAVRDYREVLALLRRHLARTATGVQRRLEAYRLRLDGLGRRRGLQSPQERLRQESQRADELMLRIARAARVESLRRGERLRGLGERLTAMNPAAVLQRGYALAFGGEGRLLRAAAEVAGDARVRIQLGSGALECRVVRTVADIVDREFLSGKEEP